MYIPKILTNSFVYTVLGVLQKAINFFLLPLYTIYLTPADYGVINVVMSIASFFSFFFTLSLQGASTRFNFKYADDSEKVRKIWGTNFLAICFNSLLWGILIFLTHRFVLDKISGDIAFYPYLLIGLLTTLLSPLYLYYQAYLQAKQKALAFSINSLLFLFVTILSTILLVVFLRMEALGVLIANLIVNSIFVIYVIIVFSYKVRLRIDAELLKESLSYSLPLLPHNLSGWVNGMLDRLFINKLVNAASVGLYSIGNQFGFIINTLGLGINQAFVPWFFEKEKSEVGCKQIVHMANIGIGILLIISFSISIFAKEILFLMTSPSYHVAWKIIPVLCYANLFDCFYYFFVAVLFLNKTSHLSYVTFSSAIIGAIINYVFILNLGYMGAAYSLLFVQLVKSIVVLILSLKKRPDIDYKWKIYYSETVFSLVVFFFLNNYIDFQSLWEIIGVKILLLLFFVVAVYLFNRRSVKVILSLFNR